MGLYEQTTPALVPDHAAQRQEFARLEAFGAALERAVPTGTQVFCMPLSAFPFDNGQIGYAHLQAYLHTHGLRWSDPAMRNRSAAVWQQEVATQPVEQMLRMLVEAGFGALLLDEKSNQPQDRLLLRRVTELTRTQPIYDGGTRYFFDLRLFAQRVKASYTPEEWRHEVEKALPPVLAVWGPEFNPPDAARPVGRWCVRPSGSLILRNHSGKPVTVELRMTLIPAEPSVRHFTVRSRLLTEAGQLPAQGQIVCWRLRIPPGPHQLNVGCDGPPSFQPRAYFRVEDYSIRVVSPVES
jgi:hypothetical protein